MHEVNIKDGIVYLKISGVIGHKEASFIISKTLEEINKLEDKGLPINVLADMKNVEEFTKDAYKIAALSIRDVDTSKIAIFGIHSDWKKPMVETIMRVSGKADRILFTDTKKEAIDWLKSKD